MQVDIFCLVDAKIKLTGPRINKKEIGEAACGSAGTPFCRWYPKPPPKKALTKA
jgi:hypothetical protein